MTKAQNNQWWRGGVIYQIYPRSYQDSNNDGIGDLPGITARLPHIASLGADAIWLSPFFKSPMKDFGYDVSDYCDISPMFGTLDDFKILVARAHELNLKVMIDQVLSHTSDEHPWFIESRRDKTNPKSDWYVWADAKDDGNPPNNWLSIFGGSAWQWDTRRCQYYLHNFLSAQPDLNFHHPQVQDALLASVKFWLDLGVDGYRLDTANFYVHDAQLRNNPPRGRPSGEDPAVNASNPYGWQWHKFDKSQPENLLFLKRLRTLLDHYPNTTMVGEIGDDDGLARVAEYTADGDKLHMAYCFDLLGTQHSASFIHHVLNRFGDIVGSKEDGGWPCWALSNHDCTRLASRWGKDISHPVEKNAFLKLSATLQMSLRGSPCIYQGDELGLTEVDIQYEELQDPFGITMWPQFKGRDGCRTPMPWSAAQNNGGFSNAKPWLPVPVEHLKLAVDTQNTLDSLLNFYTRLLHWRRSQEALIKGTQTLYPKDAQVLAFVRETGHTKTTSTKILCVFNFSAEKASLTLLSEHQHAAVIQDAPLHQGRLNGSRIDLEAWGGMFLAL